MKVELCPECGSGKINKIDPLGSSVRCEGCSWVGAESGLIATDVKATTLDIAMHVSQVLLLALTKEASMPMGRAMISAGLITPSSDGSTVARVVKAAVLGAHRAILTEIDKFQKELGSGNQS